MLRLFVPRSHRDGGRVRIAGSELRHLRTLRLGRGDRLVVFDEAGEEHDVRLDAVGGRAADAVVLATRRPARECVLDLTLAPALLKAGKMDLVIEKATELGVRRVVPIVSRHAVGEAVRLERWRRIAVSAAKQSGRTRVPDLEPAVPFDELVRRPWRGVRLVAWEGESERALADLSPTAEAAIVAVGPEGGFADSEVETARTRGFVTVTLAPRVLRAETAAIVAVALCLHRWGDLSTSGAVR